MHGGRGWAAPQKKIICPQNDVSVHFDAVFNIQKTRTVTRSFGTWILRGLIAKGTLQTQCKLSKNSWSDQSGGRSHQRPPEYATGCKVIRIGGSSA